MKWLARRDFNRIDIAGMVLTITLAQISLWWLLIMVPLALLSVVAERAAAQGVK